MRGKRAGKVTEPSMTMTPREREVASLIERDLSNQALLNFEWVTRHAG